MRAAVHIGALEIVHGRAINNHKPKGHMIGIFLLFAQKKKYISSFISEFFFFFKRKYQDPSYPTLEVKRQSGRHGKNPPNVIEDVQKRTKLVDSSLYS